jgi:hypothetical protein
MSRPVTTATLVRVKATLRTALNAAVRAGHIGTNAAARAELPAARRPKAVVWTAERVSEWQRTGVRPPRWNTACGRHVPRSTETSEQTRSKHTTR